jgi:WhiB family redox-sensing transcriptional regulator
MNEMQKTFNAVSKAKEWLEEANCRGMDTDLFFPEAGQNISPFVKEVCESCPVWEECLWYANESSSDMGIFAGMTYKTRMAWRTKNNVTLGMSKAEWENGKYRGILRKPINEWDYK